MAPAPSLTRAAWRTVLLLAVAETVTFGVLIYAVTVFVAPMQRDLGWSSAALTGAVSLGLVVEGLASPAVGRWLDRAGPRALMAGGALLAAALVWAWSAVTGLLGFYLVWLGLGLAMAAVLYEPAFATVAAWFPRRRGAALTVLTTVAGLASVIFVPWAGQLAEALGWRTALRVLAAVLGLIAVLLASGLRRAPEALRDAGAEAVVPDGSGATPGSEGGTAAEGEATGRAVRAWRSSPLAGLEPEAAWRTPSFRWLTLGFALSTFVISALSVHLVPLLLAGGATPRGAAGAVGLIGLVAMPGRAGLTLLEGMWTRRLVAAGVIALQGVGLLLLAAGAPLAWFVVLYGFGFGAITPARAAILADTFGARHYGAINGRLAMVNALARALAPVAAGAWVASRWGGVGAYGALAAPLAALCLLSAAAVLASRVPPARPARPPLNSGRP